MTRLPSCCVIALFILIGGNPAGGQPATPRPKVGLVLSGGGALGTAHVGVLRALEELRIPIDYVAGTSMGAVVGGLYASGLSPEEIDDWVRTADWHMLLSDSLPRESESFRVKRRQFEMNQGIAFNITREGVLKLPAGLVRGRNVMASLRELTVSVRHERNFDRLPIPFRAVATDFETAETVVLRKGDLVESIRASMSIPGVFEPVIIDGRVLADGGMVSNLPIIVMQQMGADVIIAVDVNGPLKKGAELDTATLMANQTLSVFVQRQMRQEIARLGPGDALVRVNLQGMAPTDFVKAPQGIDAGYEQTLQQRSVLERFSVGPEEFSRHVSRQRLARVKPVMVSFFKIHTPDGAFEHMLKAPVEFDVKDQQRYVRLQKLLGDLGQLQKYEVRDYEVIDRGGSLGLLVKADEKKIGPWDMSFGFRFGYSSTGDGDYAMLLSVRMTEINRLGAEWKTQASLGDATRVLTEFLQPVDWNRRFFIAAQGLFSSEFIVGRNAENDPLRFRLQDHLAGLDAGVRLWQSGELRVGGATGFSRVSRRLGVPDDVPTKVDRGWVHADLTIDTLDASSFATKGSYGRVSLIASRDELGATDNYTRIEGQFYRPISFGKNTLLPRVAASLKLSGDVPLYDQSPLGGFLNLSGLPRGYLYGENAALAELIYFRQLGELPPGIGRGIYGGVSIEAGEVWNEASDFRIEDATFAGSVFLGADTFLGAIYFGVGATEQGDAAVYLQLGPLFGQGRDRR